MRLKALQTITGVYGTAHAGVVFVLSEEHAEVGKELIERGLAEKVGNNVKTEPYDAEKPTKTNTKK